MAWYQEAVFYHIYPLGLVDAPKENAYEAPVHRLREAEKWISHIAEIGCNALYIGPLFESVGHGYETTDYRKLDSRLGDNEDLKYFVAKCHESGIRVIFDGVFNHTGRDFFAFKDIQQNREGSQYRDWYCNVNFYGNNEYNDGFSYDNWGGYNLLVKLNQKNPAVKDYICDVIRFWVSEFDVDGIRLDAADVLDFDFMRALRQVADTVKPDFWLMGEVIHGDYNRWVNNNTLHSVTNYVLHKALYSGHNDHNYFEIAHTIRRLADLFSNQWNSVCLYNFTDNHDVERIYTKLASKAQFYPVHILEYTLPGVPSIYYGSEFGIEGKKEKYSDASLRPALSYEDYKNAVSDNAYTAFIAALGRIRLAIKSLSYGDYREVMLRNRQYVYTRSTDRFTTIIAVNNDENEAVVSGGGIRDGIYKGMLSGSQITVSGGSFEARIPAQYGEIWVSEEEIAESSFEFAAIEGTEVKEAAGLGARSEVTAAAKIKPETAAKAVTEPKTETTAKAVTEPKTETAAKAVTEPKTETAAKAVTEPKPKTKLDTQTPNACEKYGLDAKYADISPDAVRERSDYDAMTMEELQVGILEKMAANGPVNEQMLRTVTDNVYVNSLKNWIKSFR